MIRFLSSSLLLGLIAAGPAMAQETQVIEFDFDQQQTLVTSPPDSAREPITAPVRPTGISAESNTSSAPLPPNVTEPAPAAQTTTSSTKAEDGVIVIIGEPDPPANQPPVLNEDELMDLFMAPEPEEVTLTPKGLPPTTTVPAGPGEAKIEKSTKPVEPNTFSDEFVSSRTSPKSAGVKGSETKSSKKGTKARSARPAVKTSARPAAPAGIDVDDILVRRGDLHYHRWYLASKAWSRVGAVNKNGTGSLAPGRLLVPIDKSDLPKVVPAGRVYTDGRSTWTTTTVVEITKFP